MVKHRGRHFLEICIVGRLCFVLGGIFFLLFFRYDGLYIKIFFITFSFSPQETLELFQFTDFSNNIVWRLKLSLFKVVNKRCMIWLWSLYKDNIGLPSRGCLFQVLRNMDQKIQLLIEQEGPSDMYTNFQLLSFISTAHLFVA